MEENQGLKPMLRVREGTSEESLVELKARVGSLDSFRERLAEMKAKRVGTFRQIDTYFEVPKGRLKLRQTDGYERAQLIYYEREDVAKPKKSKVFIIDLKNATSFKAVLEKALQVKVTVDKTREIYRYRGTQIHLDSVKGLGTFIEFERKTPEDSASIRKGREVLKGLMKTLGVEPQSLKSLSYSELV